MRRFAIVAAIAISAPGSVRAEDPVWEPLAGAGREAFVEIDRSSLERLDDLLTVWLRIDFPEPVASRRHAFRSAIAQHAIDCGRRRHAAIRMTTYSGQRGEGDVIDRWDRSPGDWTWRGEGTDAADARLIRLACDQAPAIALSMPITTSPP